MKSYRHIQEAVHASTANEGNVPTSLHPLSHHTPTGRIGDFVAKQKRESKKDERITNIGTSLIISLGAGALVAGGVLIPMAAMENSERQNLVRYQDGAALGEHPLVSFKVPNKANIHNHAAVDDQDAPTVLTAGDRVLCAPEVQMPDGRGHTETWALVQKDADGKTGYGFVKIGEGAAVEVIANPAGCPDRATVTLNPHQTSLGSRYSMQDPGGQALSPDFGVVKKA